MVKFYLEIELEDARFCYGCYFLYPGFNAECTYLQKGNPAEVIDGDVLTKRLDACPLKPLEQVQPEHKCETCKWDYTAICADACAFCTNMPDREDLWEPKCTK